MAFRQQRNLLFRTVSRSLASRQSKNTGIIFIKSFSSSSALDATSLNPTPFEQDINSIGAANSNLAEEAEDLTWTDPNTSLITFSEIVSRQRRLLQLTTNWLRSKNNNVFTSTQNSSLAVKSPLILIASNPPQFQAHTSIPVDNCKQNTDFTYFTGLHSGESDQLTSDCVLALFAENPDAPEISHHHSVLFAPTRTTSEQLWNGPDLANSAYRDQGFLGEVSTEIRPLSDLVDFVNSTVRRSARRDVFLSKNGLQYRPELVTHLKYYLVGTPPSLGKDPLRKDSQGFPASPGSNREWAEKWSTALAGAVSTVTVRDAAAFIDALRSIKSPAEAQALKRIGRIGSRALQRTMAWSRDHVQSVPRTIAPFYESYIAAKFEFESRLSGAKRMAFPSVCASGKRSTIIHYGRNDKALKIGGGGDWVLTDVGAEDPDGYCCDISRTWPVSFDDSATPAYQLRLQLYEALVGVQRRLIAEIRPGETSLDELYRRMQAELGKLLIEFGAFEESYGSNSTANVSALTRKICPHHVSHYIGLDIHDTPTLSRSKPLQPGMCFSIEPGLYFPKSAGSSSSGAKNLPIKPEFRGIGLRIEDDLLVDPTTGAVVNLTADCPSL